MDVDVIEILIALIILAVIMTIREIVKEPPVERKLDDTQPISNYNADYFQMYKGAELVPCVGCGKQVKRLFSVITSQGFKCQDCAKEIRGE